MRHDFELPEDDREFLDSLDRSWECIIEKPTRWVIISNFEIPEGYKVSRTNIALLIPESYPDVQIDMAYFDPPLARSDNKPIRALSLRQIDGKSWQQWSRHRVKSDDWLAGTDNIESHLNYVTAFLTSELKK